MNQNEALFRLQMARRNRLRPGRLRNRMTYDDRVEAHFKCRAFIANEKLKGKEREAVKTGDEVEVIDDGFAVLHDRKP